MNRDVTFLTYKDLPNGTEDDGLAVRELNQLGIEVQLTPWESLDDKLKVDTLCVIRSPWNYTKHLNSFLDTMEKINLSGRLLNSFETIKKNSSKKYLIDLYKTRAEREVVPSFSPNDISGISNLSFEKFVVKPLVGASSVNTFLLNTFDEMDNLFKTEPSLKREDFFIQPYCKEVETSGEVSLVFFNDNGRSTFSHGVLKRPRKGDFRVQEEFGGNITYFRPSEGLLKLSQDFISELTFGEEDFLFARMDYLKFDGVWCLSEAELIEPDLYLRIDPGAPKRFAKAIEQYCR